MVAAVVGGGAAVVVVVLVVTAVVAGGAGATCSPPEQAPATRAAATRTTAGRRRTGPWWQGTGAGGPTPRQAPRRRVVSLDGMAPPSLTPACVWRVSAELVVALDDRFGDPLDAYVNGSQVWLREDGPGGMTLEWRLHPVAGFRRPPGVGTYELFPSVALAVSREKAPPSPPESMWDGLEAFPAYGEETEPPLLRSAVVAALGIPPDAVGLVDHRVIGDEWERTGGRVSIVDALLRQLVP